MKPAPAAQPKKTKWKPARMSTGLRNRWPPTADDAAEVAKPKGRPKQVSLFDTPQSSTPTPKPKPKPVVKPSPVAKPVAKPKPAPVTKVAAKPSPSPAPVAKPKPVVPKAAPKPVAAAPPPAAAPGKAPAAPAGSALAPPPPGDLSPADQARVAACLARLEALGINIAGKLGVAAPGLPMPAPAPAPVPAPAPAAAPAPASSASGGGGGAGGFGAVLADLNKGSAITSGLKKVTSNMKTKNRPKGERSGLVSSAPKKATTTSTWAAKKVVQKEPKIYKKQQTIFVEHQPKGAVISVADAFPGKVENKAKEEFPFMKDNIFVFNCADCVIQLPEKVKAVTIDNCKKSRVSVNAVISSVEVVNCQSVTIGVTENNVVNSFAIDKTSGCQLWLSRTCAQAEPDIITSCVSEVNIQVPGPNDEDDLFEFPVPEQYKTTVEFADADKKVLKGLATDQIKHG